MVRPEPLHRPRPLPCRSGAGGRKAGAQRWGWLWLEGAAGLPGEQLLAFRGCRANIWCGLHNPCSKLAPSGPCQPSPAVAGQPVQRLGGPVAVPTNENWQAAQQTHNEIKSSPDELEEYDMRNGRMAFLMCVTTGRTGAENDIEVMRKLFQDYNFTHQECIDPFGQDIVPKLEKFRDEINQSADVVSCCLITLMSHGTRNGYISGKDEVKVNLKDIFPLFNNANCPKLRGKPKIFIIQACRGGNVDEGVEEKDNVFQESDDMMDAMRLPTTSDYYIVYSTQKGYISLRNKIIGSRMIEAMNKVFSQHGMKWHLGDLFTKVNNLLVQRDFSIDRHIVKVTIVMESTLTKAVYLTPRLANM
ncbi:caspase-14 [Alligator sinensis]|uniref:Caspase-14 n=1 Tax=Alligator sinensis TaxID=38654 RepID=A0A3Q0FWM5_ALLSI|nr:caspase-14 [Alligator sinensis]